MLTANYTVGVEGFYTVAAVRGDLDGVIGKTEEASFVAALILGCLELIRKDYTKDTVALVGQPHSSNRGLIIGGVLG